MVNKRQLLRMRVAVLLLLLLATAGSIQTLRGQEPEMLQNRLDVRQVVGGLTTPTSLAFIGPDELLVLEKNTGQVKRVVGGTVQGVVLDLAVNFGSERGLLGIALHPDFPENQGVYLYWTESTTGSDTNVLSETPLLGNRVDRFVWDGSSLAFDMSLLAIRAIQEDAGQPQRGNHDGGVITFGLDGKLYVFIGDLGRRGWLQNLPCGPTAECPGATVPDDQFGGPEPDDAHLSGVVLRLNDDGSAPADNPFFDAGADIGGEVGANVQLIYSYGHRNSFGMAIDPFSGNLWLQENGDDSFSELNLITPGMNGGWVQIAGPVSRIDQFKEIETTFGGMNLQQIRWPPENIAETSEEALSRLFMFPGAQYSDPEFSWKWEIAPGGIGFVNSRALGPQYEGDLFMGAATPNLEGGFLFHFNLTGNRQKIGVDDPRLEDRVADNLAKHDITESESLLIGRNFGVVTDLESGPNGNLYAVSLSQGAIYEIFRTDPRAQQAAVSRDDVRFDAGASSIEALPTRFELTQNYPNPFNPTTILRYALPEDSQVRLEVYDALGRRVALLIDGHQTAGWHEATFDASGLPNGVYLARLQAGAFIEMRTMALTK